MPTGCFAVLSRVWVPALFTLCVLRSPVHAQGLPPSEPPPASPPLDARAMPGDAPSANDEFGGERTLSVRARLMAGFESERARPAGAQTRLARAQHGFIVKQVRLAVRGELAELFRVNASFDLSDALSPETAPSYTKPEYIRTASIEYRPSRAFRLEVGRFKRPFSWLELESASDLPILDRGLFNELAIEDNQWGDRAIGMMASGRLKAPKLRWYLSLTNPGWSSTLANEGVDVLGRVEWSVMKMLTVGVNGGYKNIELGDDRIDNFAIGGEVALKLGDGRVVIEASSMDLPLATNRPRGLGALLLFDYSIPLTTAWALQPVFFAEFADADAKVSQSESARFVFGLNALGYEGFRVMPEFAIVRSIGDTSQFNPWLESETYSLVFSLVL